MTGTRKRRFWALLGAAAGAAGLGGLTIPGTALDKAAFATVARASANPPLFVAGNGSHTTPWTLQTFAATGRTDAQQSPTVISLGDDPTGFFQSNPPAPIDLAVVLTNMRRLGANRAATATVLAWDAPDPIGLTALDQAIRRFDSLVMTAPLSRGAVPEPMPAAFRKASIPIEAIHGDASALPVVNRIPLPGVILGGDNTLAGFQLLESEPASKFAPLLARWEDRVVFAFPLLAVLQQLELTTQDVDVRPGQYLKLGPNGPTVPIDRYGRLAVPPKPLAPRARIAAEAIIDGSDDLRPEHAPTPVVLRDDRSAAEPATRAFSQQLPALIAIIAGDTGMSPTRTYERMSPAIECTLLGLVALALAALGNRPAFSRHIGYLTIAASCIAAQCLAAGGAWTWLPGLAALAAVLAATLVAAIIPLTPPVPRPAASPRPARPTQLARPNTARRTPDAPFSQSRRSSIAGTHVVSP